MSIKLSLSKTTNFDNGLFLFDFNKKKLLSNVDGNQNSFLEKIVNNLSSMKEGDFFETYFDDGKKIKKLILVATDNEATKTDSNKIFKLGAKIGKKIINQSIPSLTIFFPTTSIFKDKAAQFCEGLLLASYRFDHYKTIKADKSSLKELSIFGVLSSDIDYAKNISSAVKLSRDIANKGGSDFTPTDFKNTSQDLSKKHGFSFTSFNQQDLKKMGMGCFYAVTKGSDQPAYLNIMEYKVKDAKQTLLLVGKGLTFDSGGISIKPAKSMEEMKFDMCGGATVLGAMDLVGKFKPKINVIALIASTENLINGSAAKPGDVVKAYNGLNVEIVNTDAEGRLILADTLAYGIKKYKPTAVIDLATLTGAIMVALGKQYSGLFSNSKSLEQQVIKAAKHTAEQVWPMPLEDQSYYEEIKSTYADIKNVGGGWGGAITAAKFLEQFVAKTKWVHLDIAGSAWDVSSVDHYPSKGATGVGVRLLFNLINNWN